MNRQTDMNDTPAPRRPQQELDPQTIAPIHGGRTYPWADFARYVTSASTN